MMRWTNILGRRLWALGLLGAVIAGFLSGARVLSSEHHAIEQRIEEGRVLLGRLEAAASKARIAATGEAATGELGDIMMAEGSEGLAIAALQTRLSDLASAAGLRIESSGGLPARVEGALTLIGLRIEISGRDTDVGKVLYSIETTHPILLIEGARIRGGQSEAETQVEASLDVYAAYEPDQQVAP